MPSSLERARCKLKQSILPSLMKMVQDTAVESLDFNYKDGLTWLETRDLFMHSVHCERLSSLKYIICSYPLFKNRAFWDVKMFSQRVHLKHIDFTGANLPSHIVSGGHGSSLQDFSIDKSLHLQDVQICCYWLLCYDSTGLAGRN